jgi:hypothetical protein
MILSLGLRLVVISSRSLRLCNGGGALPVSLPHHRAAAAQGPGRSKAPTQFRASVLRRPTRSASLVLVANQNPPAQNGLAVALTLWRSRKVGGLRPVNPLAAPSADKRGLPAPAEIAASRHDPLKPPCELRRVKPSTARNPKLPDQIGHRIGMRLVLLEPRQQLRRQHVLSERPTMPLIRRTEPPLSHERVQRHTPTPSTNTSTTPRASH